MCVTQHLLHDKVVVDRLGEFLSLVRALGLLIVANFLVEFQLRHRLVAVILAVVFKELETYKECATS